MLLPEKFPKTETAQAGIPMKELFRYTFTHPLVIGLILLMMFTLSFELGPMRWIPEVLQAAGVHGILVLVWISGLLMVRSEERRVGKEWRDGWSTYGGDRGRTQ